MRRIETDRKDRDRDVAEERQRRKRQIGNMRDIVVEEERQKAEEDRQRE